MVACLRLAKTFGVAPFATNHAHRGSMSSHDHFQSNVHFYLAKIVQKSLAVTHKGYRVFEGGHKMNKLTLLQDINLGNSVAEFDKNLNEYFISTPYVEQVIKDRYDIIRGTKGSGKSAILLNLLKRRESTQELKDVLLIPATNHQGDPVFRTGFSDLQLPLDENKLVQAWKIYIINVMWAEVKEICGEHKELEQYMVEHNLITTKPGLLNRIKFSLARIFKIKDVQTGYTDSTGNTYTATVTFGEDQEKESEERDVNYNFIFNSFNDLMRSAGQRLWVLMDRLDDAFPDNPELETVALKSLLYAYKDIAGLDNIKLKIFIRDDIYNKITENGFRSLTHVNSNAMQPIRWSEEKLLHMLTERFLFNSAFKEYAKSQGHDVENIKDNDTRDNLMLLIFRKQVDVGPHNPNSFRWIINHIRDANGNATARDLIALVDKARQYQIEYWSLNDIKDEEDYLIGPTAIKSAWSAVSKDKLETQLFAEYPSLKPHILKFKDGKAEHNSDSLSQVLGQDWRVILEELKRVGFIEEISSTWKIPFIYREGLNISQGKAF